MRKGFTLVELLIVVAIIAVVASILFPVFFLVRENGRRTTCLNNERQLGLALLQYTSDHDENWPSGTVAHSNQGVGWAGQSYPYVKSTETFHCPDDPTHLVSAIWVGPDVYFPISYGYNTAISVNKRVNSLSSPSKIVLLFEAEHNTAALISSNTETSSAAGDGGEDSGFSSDPAKNTYPGGDAAAGQAGSEFPLYATGNMGGRILNGTDGSTPRHRNGANYLACDGHAAWLMPSEVSCGLTPRTSDAPQTAFGAAGTADPAYRLTFSVR